MFDHDFVVIGSGFGGSVSALRLTEKGYKVAVLEQGKRFGAKDFAKTNWNVWKYLWMPKLGFHGIQQITLLRDVLVFHGAGVGGGSLVYANTLLSPPETVFRDPRWPSDDDWASEARPPLPDGPAHAGRDRGGEDLRGRRPAAAGRARRRPGAATPSRSTRSASTSARRT